MGERDEHHGAGEGDDGMSKRPYPRPAPKTCAGCGFIGTYKRRVLLVGGTPYCSACRPIRMCSESACDKKVHADGLCNSHWNKQYYAANPTYHQARARRWHAANPEKAAEQRRRRDPLLLRSLANRRARRRYQAEGQHTPAQVRARIAYYGWRCWRCRAPWEEVDHVKPVSKGGCEWPANLRPICVQCNRRKLNHWDGPQSLRKAGQPCP